MKFSHHEQTTSTEHPFAPYVRILGKGKHGSRPLTQDEAFDAMRMILTDQVLPIQLGAFLMLLRVKEETPEELAGFTAAAREVIPAEIRTLQADLDWPTYAGKRRHLPWFLLSALLLAENGIKVFMHGAKGPASERLYIEDMLDYLGLAPANSVAEAKQQLAEQSITYLSLENFCPKLQEIIELRPILGLRSPVHTLVRLLNPSHADYSIQGIFHPGYRPVHQLAAQLLKQPHAAVLKGEGGESERNPDVSCLVQSVHDGEIIDEEWPPLFAKRHVKPETLEPSLLLAIWQGLAQDDYAEASIIGTAAVALKLLGKATTQNDATRLASEYWSKRAKNRFFTASQI